MSLTMLGAEALFPFFRFCFSWRNYAGSQAHVDKLLYRVYAQRYKLADADICWFVLCEKVEKEEEEDVPAKGVFH